MTLKQTLILITLVGLSTVLLTGCIQTTHEIKPIHITMDVNLKVDKHLDDFFAKPVEPLLTLEEQERSEREKTRIRFSERRPAIDHWKTKGIVGEAPSGYLAFVEESADETVQALVKAENADRKLVYTAIAEKESTTPELVGRLRAERIADRAQPGDYLMNAQGEWVQVK